MLYVNNVFLLTKIKLLMI